LKATGIVRRIDDLGRVVIPKEIRRTLRIREGDPLEIFTDKEGEVILKKYSPIGELGDFATQYAESLHKASGHITCIADRDTIIAVLHIFVVGRYQNQSTFLIISGLFRPFPGSPSSSCPSFLFFSFPVYIVS
jgi:stage V sporulation protein T